MNRLISQINDADYQTANSVIRRLSGIVDYFSSEEEKCDFVLVHGDDTLTVCEDRVLYGDWQTPESLARKVCENHQKKFGNPDIVIEPTCGLGSFVFAAIEKFHDVSEIHALDINHTYTDALKFNLLVRALGKTDVKHPDIYIYNADFFEFDFSNVIAKARLRDCKLAIIGNPPWITNSRQGRGNAANLPKKHNDYGLKGIDAITGKSNFDISEYITLEMLKLAIESKGGMSFLLKNSVIRNVLTKQKTKPLNIINIEQLMIDAKAEFDVAVEASCFSVGLGGVPSMTCLVKNFYSEAVVSEYGWVGDAFVSDTQLYNHFSKYDSISNYTWRSGIKHDCTSILELTLTDDGYRNSLGEIVEVEDDMVFPLLKSSDINSFEPHRFRKYIIVPQRRVGESTDMLKVTHPLTHEYLTNHQDKFLKRKSNIYKGKDKFSIFGIGDYTFKPYKIVVSSLYKTVNFVLVSQEDDKPVIVDDTCYQLGFDSLEEATKIYNALMSDEIQSLLKSLTFNDAKRVVTKNLLMRLDVARYFEEN